MNKACVTVTYGMRGFFAVHLEPDEDCGGMLTPWESGMGSYETPDAAQVEAQQWADELELPCEPHGYPEGWDLRQQRAKDEVQMKRMRERIAEIRAQKQGEE